MDGEQSNSTGSGEVKSRMGVPTAIVVAGLIIAAAIFLTQSQPVPVAIDTAPENPTASATIKPVTDTDRILGNPDAELIIVEYSDPECPYCKVFHETMHQLMSEYGRKGDLAWVYRQFPIPSLHPKAPKESEAVECAAELGGNDAFWRYLDRLFEVTPANNGLDLAELPKIAEYIGLDRATFTACLDSGKHAETIDTAYADAVAVGAPGTPYSIIISKSGEKQIINGAETYEMVKVKIEAMLKK